MNLTLFSRELKKSIPLMLIISAVIAMYTYIIIWMFDPEMIDQLNMWVEAMPEIMAAAGMTAAATNLLEFEVSYLYGLIFLMLPLVFILLRNNSLIKKYVEDNSIVALLAAPVKRVTVVFTQVIVLVISIFLLVCIITGLQLTFGEMLFPGQTPINDLLLLNVGLFGVLLVAGSIAFCANCTFNDSRISSLFAIGIPILMFVLQMIGNLGGDMEVANYFTYYTLFNPINLLAGESSALLGVGALYLIAIILFTVSIIAFKKRDLHI